MLLQMEMPSLKELPREEKPIKWKMRVKTRIYNQIKRIAKSNSEYS